MSYPASLQQVAATTCYVNLICAHTRLIVSTAEESDVRVVQVRSVSLHMSSLVPIQGLGCTACHLADLWGRFS